MKTIHLRPTAMFLVALVATTPLEAAFAQGTVVPGDVLDEVSGDAPAATPPTSSPRTARSAPAAETDETPRRAAAVGPRPALPASTMGQPGRPLAQPATTMPATTMPTTMMPPTPATTMQNVLRPSINVGAADPFGRMTAPGPTGVQAPARNALNGAAAQPVMPGAITTATYGDQILGIDDPVVIPPALPKKPSMADVSPASDEEAARLIEESDRTMRVLKARDDATKVKLDLLKKEADIRKADLEGLPPPIVQLPRQQVFAAPPAPSSLDKAAEKAARDEKEHSNALARFATVSIAGPEGRLTAVMRVRGFGDVQVRKGTSLPSGFKVADVEARGVSIKKDVGPAVLVPFIAQ